MNTIKKSTVFIISFLTISIQAMDFDTSKTVATPIAKSAVAPLAELCTKIILHEWENITELDPQTLAATREVDRANPRYKKILINSLLAAHNLLQDETGQDQGPLSTAWILSPDKQKYLWYSATNNTFEIHKYKKLSDLDITVEKLLTLQGDPGRFDFLQWGKQGKSIFCFQKDPKPRVTIWDAKTGLISKEIPLLYYNPIVKATPDEQKIIIKEMYQPLKIYGVNDTSCISMGADTGINAFDISIDGKYVAKGEDMHTKLYDISSGKHVKTFQGDTWPQFSKNGKYIITRSIHCDKVLISDVANSQVIKVIQPEPFYGISINPYCNKIKIHLTQKDTSKPKQALFVPYINTANTTLSGILAYIILMKNKRANQPHNPTALKILENKENEELLQLFKNDERREKHPEYLPSC